MKFDQIAAAEQIFIYGFGKEGRSSFDFLAARFPDKEIKNFDDNSFEKNVQEKIFVDNFPDNPCCADDNNCCVVVVSPGISREKLKNVSPNLLTSNTEIFFDNLPEIFRKKVVGISGTKGKSTTCKFTHEVLKMAGVSSCLGGNYGEPLLSLFDDFINKKFDFVIAELSSFQLENLQTSPGIGIFLNFYSDHLDRHGCRENYFDAKKNLWAHQKSDDVLIFSDGVGFEDFIKNEFENSFKNPVIAPKMSVENFPSKSIFRAPYFLQNFGAVASLASVLNFDLDVVKKCAENFKGLPHRMEFVAEKNGIIFYNDALSTNPSATKMNVEFFGDDLGAIILGGQDRAENFDDLIQSIKTNTDAFIIILESEVTEKINNSCKKIGITNFKIVKNLKEAVEKAFEQPPKKKACLLSTAAPSFGMFKNYEEQGKEFKKLVRKS